MSNKATLLAVGAIFLIIGYLIIKAGNVISSSIPAWFPYVGSLGALIGSAGFWVIIFGIAIIILVGILFLMPRPSQRGIVYQ